MNQFSGQTNSQRQWRFLPLVCAMIAAGACTKKPVLKGAAATLTSTESTVTTISSGTVEAEQQATLGFSTTGRVSRVTVKAGDSVTQGQVLAELDNRDLLSIANDARAELGRTRELYQSSLVAKAALDTAAKNVDVAAANYDRSVIKAPFTGIVTEVNLDVGELYSPNSAQSPMRIVDLGPRVVKGEIDEIDLGRVKKGQSARIKIPAVRAAAFTATVTRVVPYVSTSREQDRSSQIELKISDAKEIIPVGASADVEIIVEVRERALCVPSRSILGTGKDRYVYVGAQDRLRRTPVVLGVGNYERTEIKSGLKVGDVVVLPSDEVELKDGYQGKIETQPWP